ncbi:MAG: glycerate kinase, partial [Eubacteriales bacterium]|nr:glycerate kinase [Eubacteriales bacterium]
LIAAGKAAWQMAKAAYDHLGNRIDSGVVVTKYDHSRGPIGNLAIYEAGHPVPDQNSFRATQAAIDAVTGLTERDTVLFLLSGGGSALFEKPLIPEEDLNRLTRELLACGADIVQMNTVRKRFSAVKGGRFAALCKPAKVFTIVLSDVLGDRLDMIASGPAYPDASTAEDALRIVRSCHLTMTEQMEALLRQETPKELDNVTTHITGSVRQLCIAAQAECRRLGYEPVVLTDRLSCTARDAGVFLGNIAQYYQNCGKPMAFLAGGETVVHLTGTGLGGRNQELALAAAEGIAGINACVFSVGSDGTDGPTDAAGGYTDGTTRDILKAKGILISDVLQRNDAYHALEACGGLIITGATGTNVNDLSVLLIGS